VAGTAYELYEACESMKDLDELYAGLGMTGEVPEDVVRGIGEAGCRCFGHAKPEPDSILANSHTLTEC